MLLIGWSPPHGVALLIKRVGKVTEFCKECDGWGLIEVDSPRPHGFDRDVGYIDVDKIECPECEGTGEKELENDLSK